MTTFIDQLTAPRTVQAFMVVCSMMVVSVLVVTDRAVPELMSGILFAIVGFYFSESRREHHDGFVLSARGTTAEAVASGLSGSSSSSNDDSSSSSSNDDSSSSSNDDSSSSSSNDDSSSSSSSSSNVFGTFVLAVAGVGAAMVLSTYV
jgi:hypothetical protein